MQTFGVEIASNDGQFSVQKQEYEIIEYTIEPDISSASYFWALAALSGGAIVVEKVDTNSKQGDLQILQIIEKMGAHVVIGNKGIKVIGNTLNPVEVDMSNCPDQVQTIAVVAAFASGTTTIHGVQTLRLKETDRLSAIISELKKMNIVAETNGQTLVIHGGDPKGAVIETYLDHRMAMSFAIAGSRLDNMKIINPKVVSKTFPDFWDKLRSIGVEIS
jgi:3-phosphoshikimate 1-carboxyvinyltransferase